MCSRSCCRRTSQRGAKGRSRKSRPPSAPARQLSSAGILCAQPKTLRRFSLSIRASSEAQVNLGLAYQSLLDYSAASHYLSQALRERPNLPNVTSLWGWTTSSLASRKRRRPILTHALALDASSPDAHDAMALYCLTQENFQGAAEQYRKVADLDRQARGDNSDPAPISGSGGAPSPTGALVFTRSPRGHRFLGDMLYERARWDDAGREYEKALAIEPRQSGLHTLLGEVHLHTGKVWTMQKRSFAASSRWIRGSARLAGPGKCSGAKGRAAEALASAAAVWQGSAEFLKVHPTISRSRTRQGEGTSLYLPLAERAWGGSCQAFSARSSLPHYE